MKILIIIFLSFTHIFLLTNFAVAQPDPILQTVIVEGTAPVVDENRADAKNEAINDAMKNAFREVISELLSSEVIEDNQNELERLIDKKSRDYVQGYKVMIEYLDVVDNVSRVILETAIFKGELRKKFGKQGLLFKGKDIHQIVIIIDEKRIGGSFNYTNFWANTSVAEQAIKKHIMKKGFSVLSREDIKGKISQNMIFQAINGNIRAASDIGTYSDAEIVIIGNAVSRIDIMREAHHDMKPLKANMRIKAIRTDKAEVMAALSDYVEETAYDEIEGSNTALTRIGEKVADILIEKIIKSWEGS